MGREASGKERTTPNSNANRCVGERRGLGRAGAGAPPVQVLVQVEVVEVVLALRAPAGRCARAHQRSGGASPIRLRCNQRQRQERSRRAPQAHLGASLWKVAHVRMQHALHPQRPGSHLSDRAGGTTQVCAPVGSTTSVAHAYGDMARTQRAGAPCQLSCALNTAQGILQNLWIRSKHSKYVRRTYQVLPIGVAC